MRKRHPNIIKLTKFVERVMVKMPHEFYFDVVFSNRICAYNFGTKTIFISKELIRRNLIGAYCAFLHELGHGIAHQLGMEELKKKDMDLFWDKNIISENLKTDEAIAWGFAMLIYNTLKLKFGKDKLKYYTRRNLKAYELKDISL